MPLSAAAILAGCGDLDRAAGVPTHYVGHQMCSAVFVGGLDPDMYYREAVEPVIAPAGLVMDYRIDRNRKEVTADLAGQPGHQPIGLPWRRGLPGRARGRGRSPDGR